MADSSRFCSVWLGSETGLLKGVSLTRKRAFNFSSARQLSREQEVRALCWSGPEQRELLLGCADGTVRTFSTERGAFTAARRRARPEDGGFAGLAALGGATVTCAERGALRVWREDGTEPDTEPGTEPLTELHAGSHVSRMRQSPVNLQHVATGGKENPLKIWDLQRPDTPAFTARNLRDDWLQLRRPHWVRDLSFIPESGKVVTCTGYHQVHVFDPASPQRRPVLEAEYGEYPLTALSLPPGGQSVVVGNTQGQIAVLDLRKAAVSGCLKGLTGGVRALQCHASQPVVASCGLDRFLRVHSLEDRKLLHKVYLKSRLNCLLFASREEPGEEAPVEVKEEEEDEVWAAMERVEEAPKRKTTEEEEQEEEEVKKKKSKKKKKKEAFGD